MNEALSSSSSRRRLPGAIALAVLAATLAGCGPDSPQLALNAPPPPSDAAPKPVKVAAVDPRFSALYQPVADKFEVPGVPKAVVRKGFDRLEVDYATVEKPGTVVVDPHAHYLYFVEPNGKAMRYGVAVGKAGFIWSGEAYIKTKQEWPDWYPPKEMIDRHPELKPQLDKLRSGIGVAGGYRNPARRPRDVPVAGQ